MVLSTAETAFDEDRRLHFGIGGFRLVTVEQCNIRMRTRCHIDKRKVCNAKGTRVTDNPTVRLPAVAP